MNIDDQIKYFFFLNNSARIDGLFMLTWLKKI